MVAGVRTVTTEAKRLRANLESPGPTGAFGFNGISLFPYPPQIEIQCVIENALNIYTDGSSLSHQRLGGIGIRFVTCDSQGEEVTEDVELPGYKNATNNQMELHACVEALKEALRYKDLTLFDSIAIHTDSRYVVDNYRKAMFEWPKTRWTTRDGPPVLNADLWKDLIKQMKNCQPLRVNFYWVKGHSKDQHNKAVDKLAKKSAKRALNTWSDSCRILLIS
jgi:ribonuclease HI